VTPAGEEVLRIFRALQRKAAGAVVEELAQLEALAAKPRKD
jgi:hypothetical protein